MEDTLAIDGVNISYEYDGNGEHLLLIHGLGSGKSIWGDLISAGSGLFSVRAPDLPGFGSSDMPDIQYGVPYYVRMIKAFMEASGIEKAAIVGISMGGAIAASLAASYPENVSKLVLIAPTGLTPPKGGIAKVPLLKNAGYWLMSHNKEMFRRSVEEMFFDKSMVKESFVNYLWEKMKKPAFRRTLMKNSVYLSHVDPAFEASLAGIKAKTLIIWGLDDAILPSSDADRFAARVPGADVRILKNCGHMVHIEQREVLVNTVLSFLGEIDLYYPNEDTTPQA